MKKYIYILLTTNLLLFTTNLVFGADTPGMVLYPQPSIVAYEIIDFPEIVQSTGTSHSVLIATDLSQVINAGVTYYYLNPGVSRIIANGSATYSLAPYIHAIFTIKHWLSNSANIGQ